MLLKHWRIDNTNLVMYSIILWHSQGPFFCFDFVHPLFREYVSSRTINKVIQVHDQIFCCMAGSLADAQAVTKTAKFHLSFHRCHTHIWMHWHILLKYKYAHRENTFITFSHLNNILLIPTFGYFPPNFQTGIYSFLWLLGNSLTRLYACKLTHIPTVSHSK